MTITRHRTNLRIPSPKVMPPLLRTLGGSQEMEQSPGHPIQEGQPLTRKGPYSAICGPLSKVP